ncbi:hypothetical protein B0E53_06703 [Micromonospora sp. MH33]|nr:hypothetical protein B0E53_06703 [Micromonospora sp. MH33]
MVGLRRLGHVEPQGLVDDPPAGHVVPVDEGHRDTGRAGPAGAADPVGVGVLVLGAVVVDDVGDAGDVEPAGRHVGGDQDVDLAGPERPQRPLPRTLAQVAVDGGDRETAEVEVLGHPVGGPLGPGEDHGEPATLRLEDARHDLDLVHRVGAVDQLLGLRRRAGLGGVPGVDGHRPAQEAPGQRDDRVRHGGREEHGLPVLRQHGQDLLDVVQEAQVEHPVGLVEHQRVHPVEPEVLLLGQVQQPARGADQDLDTLAQRVDLRLVRDAAVDRQHPDAPGAPRGVEVLGDLEAQLAGGDDDQRLRHAVAALGGGEDALQQRDAEAEGLAGAGRRLADQVDAAQPDRQRVLLDGEGAGDAGGGQRLDGLLAGAELGERGSFRTDRSGGGQFLALNLLAHLDLGVPSRGAPRHVLRARTVWRGPHGRGRCSPSRTGPHARRGRC